MPKITKIRSESELGNFISKKLKEKEMSQSDLASKIAKLRGKGYSKNSIKDNVSKWIRGDRYPRTEYLYYLSQALKVDIEEILVAEEECMKYKARPFTLYAVAKSGNKEALDKLMLEVRNGCYPVGADYDEFDETLLDYIFEFENIELIQHLLENNYICFHYKDISYNTVFSMDGANEYFDKFLTLALKYDDVYIFKNIIKKFEPFYLRDNEKIDSKELFTCRRQSITMSKDNVLKILNTKKILNYLTTPYKLTEKDLCYLYGDFVYPNNSIYLNREVTEIETIHPSFNLLLNLAILENLDISKKLIKVAQNYNFQIEKKLKELYSPIEYRIDNTGNVILEHSRRILTRYAGLIDSIKDREKYNLYKLF